MGNLLLLASLRGRKFSRTYDNGRRIQVGFIRFLTFL